WSCSRSQGQPLGERKRAITLIKSLMAEVRFIPSEDDQIIPMHHLDPLELPGFNFTCIKPYDSAGELQAVQITNAHDFPRRELALAPRHARRQQTLARVAQGLLGALVHEQRAFGMVKEG